MSSALFRRRRCLSDAKKGRQPPPFSTFSPLSQSQICAHIIRLIMIIIGKGSIPGHEMIFHRHSRILSSSSFVHVIPTLSHVHSRTRVVTPPPRCNSLSPSSPSHSLSLSPSLFSPRFPLVFPIRPSTPLPILSVFLSCPRLVSVPADDNREKEGRRIEKGGRERKREEEENEDEIGGGKMKRGRVGKKERRERGMDR